MGLSEEDSSGSVVRVVARNGSSPDWRTPLERTSWDALLSREPSSLLEAAFSFAAIVAVRTRSCSSAMRSLQVAVSISAPGWGMSSDRGSSRRGYLRVW